MATAQVLLALLPWLAGVGSQAADYDLVIRRGRIADGTGQPSYAADVAVREGRIVEVGEVQGQGAVELQAAGLVVAPGFIDVHTHAEEIVDWPLAENFVRMGVTTLVLGNCGSSVTNVGEFFTRLERISTSVNVATLIGHGTVREQVMGGSFQRAPTATELARMQEAVGRAMEEGAVGLSTGLIYLPGVFAETEELIEVARAAAARGGIYATHMRDEGTEIIPALEEVFRISREAGLRAEISHLKLVGEANWGRAQEVLKTIDRARSEGLEITHDQYLYTASSTGISQLIPEEARAGGRLKQRLADPEERARIVSQMKEKLARRGRTDYGYAVIAHWQADSALDGLNIVEAARLRRGSDSLDDQIDLILEIQSRGGASGVFHGMSEEDLRQILEHPKTMVAADSGIRVFNEGMPHPRGYGNNARLLSRYVRELGLLPLEEAVRRMTSLPARTFRFDRRGEVAEGFWADLAVFDPAQVRDRATFRQPHQYATGFAWVLVNGQVVVQNDQHTAARPGKVLRHRPPDQ